MATRLIKESRDLLPTFVGTVLLIVLPYAIWGGQAQYFGYLAFGLGCVIMGASSFGNEFQNRTLPLLLSQPIARPVVWLEKMLVLGAALVLTLLALWACLGLVYRPALAAAPGMLVLIALCAFGGTPYFTLLVRNGVSGAVFSVLFPCLILAGTVLVKQRWSPAERASAETAVPLLIVYSLCCAALGHRKFKKLQVLDLASREVGLPARLEALLLPPITKVFSGFTAPFASLLKKEMRLQQPGFLIAGVFCLLVAASICSRWLRPNSTESITFFVAISFGYVLILPLLVGAISVSEERAWEIAEWHLTLPPSAVQQWSAKILIALGTTLVLGVLLPAGALLGWAALSGSLLGMDVVLVCLLAQLLLLGTAIYTASFSNSPLRAILLACGLILAMTWVGTIGNSVAEHLTHFSGRPVAFRLPHFRQWETWYLFFVWLMLLFSLLQWLAFSNFRRGGLRVSRFVGQTLLILGFVVCAAMIYTLNIWDFESDWFTLE